MPIFILDCAAVRHEGLGINWEGESLADLFSAMRLRIEKGRQTSPALEIGICGEHGGEPNSIEFCHLVGLNYVSCSPYRVPIALLAAAQAAVSNKDQSKDRSGSVGQR